MAAYILRRLLLIVPTLLGIMIINFVIVQAVPGGPVQQAIAQLSGEAVDATARFSGAGQSDSTNTSNNSANASQSSGVYRGARGLDPEFIRELERQYGFDKPAHERFVSMLWNYVRFEFGTSYFRDVSVIGLVVEKMDVSISLGLWTTLIVYFISIPLGVAKAVRDGSRFDIATSALVTIGFAIPGFLFAILLVVLFAGGNYLDLFPLRGLTSANWDTLSWFDQILDYFWHLALPVTAMVVSGFASLTMLTKNSFLDEINKHYVMTARAKGASERRVLYAHVFRNAMLIVVAGFPGAFISIFFTGSLLIEVIFSLDGLGLLSYEAVLTRDYPVMLGTLYIFSLLGLVIGLLSDLMYVVIDPRIDFDARG
jgi:microcin C transport system permease protein